MKKIFTLLLSACFFFANAQVDGTLDGSFGSNGDGTSTTSIGSGTTIKFKNQKTIVLPNRKLLQVFSVDNNTGSQSDFGLARYDSIGFLDPTFGSSTPGYVTTDLGGDDYATSVAVQPNGIIVVVGYSVTASGGAFAIARYDSNGKLDTYFHTTGTLVTKISGDDQAYSVALQPGSQNIIVAGFSSPNPLANAPTQIVVAKFDTTGNFDPTFNTTGKVITATNANANEAFSVALQADGKIVVAGDRINASNLKEFLVLRYTSTGTLDPLFGGGSGFVTTKISATNDYANSVAIQSDKMIVAAGSGNKHFALVRYTSTGAPDASFGITDPADNPVPGAVTTTIGDSDVIYSVAQQLDGRLVVAGSTLNLASSTRDFALARYNPDGTLDNTFNNPTQNNNPPAGAPKPGVLTIDFQIMGTSYDDVSYSIAAQDNKLIVGGVTGNNLALARVFNSSSLFDPLPLSLYSFTATKENNEVVLNWKTAAERNTDYFEVQRSTNGINYTAIGKVTASNNSSTGKNYSYTDGKPSSPINFYRLRMVDKDLKQSYSPVLSIRFDALTVYLLVFPNPVKDVMNMQINTKAGPLTIRVFDAAGRLVNVLNLQSPGGAFNAAIDAGSWKAGVYFLKVNGDNIKVMKE